MRNEILLTFGGGIREVESKDGYRQYVRDPDRDQYWVNGNPVDRQTWMALSDLVQQSKREVGGISPDLWFKMNTVPGSVTITAAARDAKPQDAAPKTTLGQRIAAEVVVAGQDVLTARQQVADAINTALAVRDREWKDAIGVAWGYESKAQEYTPASAKKAIDELCERFNKEMRLGFEAMERCSGVSADNLMPYRLDGAITVAIEKAKEKAKAEQKEAMQKHMAEIAQCLGFKCNQEQGVDDFVIEARSHARTQQVESDRQIALSFQKLLPPDDPRRSDVSHLTRNAVAGDIAEAIGNQK